MPGSQVENSIAAKRHHMDYLHAEVKGPEDTLLIESVLAIVQNYYVDSQRVSNHLLLNLILDQLSKHKGVLLELSETEAKVEFGGLELNVELKSSYSTDELVSYLARFSRLISSNSMPRISDGNKQFAGEPEFSHYQILNMLLMALDPHSSLLDKFLYKELRQGTEGSFGGLGVVVGVKDDVLTVIKPIPNSPAARAGIQRRDKIIKINETVTYGASLESLVEHMRGEPGTLVHLSLMRNGAYAPQDIALKREIIQVDSVIPQLVVTKNARILRLAIESFSARTSREVRDLIIHEERKKPLDGIVLDLRSNPGGLLDQAVNVSDLFLTKGKIVSTRGRRVEVEEAGIGYSEFKHPLIVLINRDSASASEIVAGALKDNDRGIIIGQPSFGKGSVQTIFELPGDQALKLTIARYYTPSGVSIQNIGIYPDIWLQPILRRKKNENVFGNYRYHTERFLKNSLDRGAVSLPRREQMLTSYYLADELQDSPLDEVGQDDFEFSLAKELIDQIAHDYGKLKLRPILGARHFLARYNNYIRSITNKANQRVENWLASQFDIDWSKSELKSFDRSKLDLKLDIPGEVVLSERGELQIQWFVANRSKMNLEQASIFVHLQSLHDETYEYLIGAVANGNSRSGVINLPLRDEKGLDSLVLSYGFAQNGMPLLYRSEAHRVKVVRGALPEIQVASSISEEIGGHVPGLIEAGEEAVLTLEIQNSGKGHAADLTMDVSNFSGKQLKLDRNLIRIGGIGVGKKRSFRLKLEAASSIMADELMIGVSIRGKNLLKSLKQKVGIPSVKNKSRRPAAALFGH